MSADAPKKRPPQPVRAYGDRIGDGAVQMSFTLPVPASARAKEAARQYAESHGLRQVLVATMLADLEELGIADRTAVVLVGDHGEELFERGAVGHGATLRDEVLRTPLVVFMADRARGLLQPGQPSSANPGLNESGAARPAASVWTKSP